MIRTSFRSKLMLLTIVPLAVAQLVTLFAVMRTVQADIEARAHESLVIGGAVVEEFLAGRGEQLRTSVAVLSADFGLKQATATSDADTIRSVLENHGRRIRADMAMLVDLDGNTVASTFPMSTGRPHDIAAILDDVGNRGVESTAILDGIAYHVLAVPLRAPTTIGWVLLGFRIDDLVANRLAGLTGLDVSIVSRQVDRTVVLARTRAPRADSLDLEVPFVEGSDAVAVVLQRSLSEAMAPYVEARRGLVAFGIALVVFVAIGGVLFSATISRPLRTLAAAAQRMISGNYDDDVKVESGDEFGDLASSFNAMRTAIAEREQRITHQALHDSLTDLPNRYRVLQQLTLALEDARNSGQSVSVLSIRLSGMGEISSTLGHKAGDELIKVAAKQMRKNLSDDDVLGHTGTYEFVLILVGQDLESALITVEKVEQILATGISLDSVDVSLHANVGIAEFPVHGDDAAELLRFATIARSDAESSEERVKVYETGREDEFARRLRVVSDLRSAIRRDEIDVWMQPKISLPDGKVCGVEALVRWQHPELGFMAPDQFIPAAEQAGTIVHLSRYVLEKAVQLCRALQDKGQRLHVSVNLSTRDLLDEYLPYHVLQILKDHKVDPGDLTLEVTESSIMEDVGRAVLVLECLRDIGVRLSMDDFGTGHSSLAQLRNIPLHELKIDKSFVMPLAHDHHNESIVKTTIALAHNLELAVVAEGVEDEATMRRISQLGCQQAQGYFLSKPLPFDELVEWLDDFQVVEYAERRSKQRAFSA